MYYRPDAVVLVSLSSNMGTVIKETSVILLTGHLQLQTAQWRFWICSTSLNRKWGEKLLHIFSGLCHQEVNLLTLLNGIFGFTIYFFL